MNLGEFFRLDVNNEFLQVVQGNIEDLVGWDKCHEFVQVILETVGFCTEIPRFSNLVYFVHSGIMTVVVN